MTRPTGCPCGCAPDTRADECLTNRPVPTIKGCGGCQSLGAEEIAACARAGYFCGPDRCALWSLKGGAA